MPRDAYYKRPDLQFVGNRAISHPSDPSLQSQQIHLTTPTDPSCTPNKCTPLVADPPHQFAEPKSTHYHFHLPPIPAFTGRTLMGCAASRGQVADV